MRISPFQALLMVVFLFFVVTLPANADTSLLVFGDSWGVGSFLGLEKSFAANAPGHGVVSGAIAGETAQQMNSDDPDHGLPYITSTIAANPTVDMVHLSIGGNDMLFHWRTFKNMGKEEDLYNRITDDIEEIVLHMLAQRPDIEVFYSSYDYLLSIDGWGTPLEQNTPFVELHRRVEERLGNTPRVTTHSFYGFMQTLYGYSPNGIPPGDPSLPDINLPGPPEPFFDAIHFTWDMGDGSPGPFGYDQFADEQFDVFYRSRVVPEPSILILYGFSGIVLLMRRTRR